MKKKKNSSRFIKHNRLKKPLLSSQDVRRYLRSLGIEARLITLICHRQRYRWIILGADAQKKRAVYTLDFFAYRLEQHARSPEGIPACQHSLIELRRQFYRIEEFGGEINLIKQK